tara:strand:+ start:1437 stop:1661 length:225 start_codon:yes stop_codon:yes gene_type:complete
MTDLIKLIKTDFKPVNLATVKHLQDQDARIKVLEDALKTIADEYAISSTEYLAEIAMSALESQELHLFDIKEES